MLNRFFSRKFVRDTLILQVGRIGITGMTFVSSLLVVRLMGTETYGLWSLAQSFLTIWQSLNLTGVGITISTQLAIAVGAKDEPEILNLLAFYVQVSVGWAIFLTAAMALTGPFLATLAYQGETRIVVIALWLSLTTLPDALYNLVLVALQSQRTMGTLAVLMNINQLVLLLSTAAALVISPTPESLVVGRLVYSTSTMFLALWFYQRERTGYSVAYPPIREILHRAHTVSPRGYWGFGFLNALDKNISNLYTEIPLQIVGFFAGKTAAGYLEVGFKALTIPATFTSAVSDNLQAVIPQAVGRRDFAYLRKNLNWVIGILILAAVGFYALFALSVPIIVFLFGKQWTPAIPAIIALSVYGGVTMVGGIFGPLYRALNLLRWAIIVKLLSFAVIVFPAWLLFQQFKNVSQAWMLNGALDIGLLQMSKTGALYGAWMVNGLYIVSVALMMLITLPTLKRLAAKQ